MNEKLKNIKDLVAVSDKDTWDILTALRGSDLDRGDLKYITTGVIRHMVGMREISLEAGHLPTGAIVVSWQEAWEKLGNKLVSYKEEWKKEHTHFCYHIHNAQGALARLGHPDAIYLEYILEVLEGSRAYSQTITESKRI